MAFLPFLTEKQVQLYHPLLLPLMLGVLGALCIGIGAHRGAATVRHEEAARARITIDASETKPELDPVPEPVLANPPPRPARPRLVAKSEPYRADVSRIMRGTLKRPSRASVSS